MNTKTIALLLKEKKISAEMLEIATTFNDTESIEKYREELNFIEALISLYKESKQ